MNSWLKIFASVGIASGFGLIQDGHTKFGSMILYIGIICLLDWIESL